MKKWIALLLCVGQVFTFTACGKSNEGQQVNSDSIQSSDNSYQTTESQQDEPESSSMMEESSEIGEESSDDMEEPENSELVVYFSWSGNTETVAKEIQSQTGADIFRIEPAEAYTNDYNTLLDIAQEEQRNDARPEIAGTIENFSDYDVIYLGFPNWWGDMPMIVYSFFDEYDLSGKTLAPFCTSGGSGFSGTINTMETLEPDATITEGLHIRDSAAENPGEAVTEWLTGFNFAE